MARYDSVESIAVALAALGPNSLPIFGSSDLAGAILGGAHIEDPDDFMEDPANSPASLPDLTKAAVERMAQALPNHKDPLGVFLQDPDATIVVDALLDATAAAVGAGQLAPRERQKMFTPMIKVLFLGAGAKSAEPALELLAKAGGASSRIVGAIIGDIGLGAKVRKYMTTRDPKQPGPQETLFYRLAIHPAGKDVSIALLRHSSKITRALQCALFAKDKSGGPIALACLAAQPGNVGRDVVTKILSMLPMAGIFSLVLAEELCKAHHSLPQGYRMSKVEKDLYNWAASQLGLRDAIVVREGGDPTSEVAAAGAAEGDAEGGGGAGAKDKEVILPAAALGETTAPSRAWLELLGREDKPTFWWQVLEMPVVCPEFRSGRQCPEGEKCKMVHVTDATLSQFLNKDCCPRHGAPLFNGEEEEVPSSIRIQFAADGTGSVMLAGDLITPTKGLTTLMNLSATPTYVTDVPFGELCRKHLQGCCGRPRECRRVHLCREAMKELVMSHIGGENMEKYLSDEAFATAAPRHGAQDATPPPPLPSAYRYDCYQSQGGMWIEDEESLHDGSSCSHSNTNNSGSVVYKTTKNAAGVKVREKVAMIPPEAWLETTETRSSVSGSAPAGSRQQPQRTSDVCSLDGGRNTTPSGAFSDDGVIVMSSAKIGSWHATAGGESSRASVHSTPSHPLLLKSPSSNSFSSPQSKRQVRFVSHANSEEGQQQQRQFLFPQCASVPSAVSVAGSTTIGESSLTPPTSSLMPPPQFAGSQSFQQQATLPAPPPPPPPPEQQQKHQNGKRTGGRGGGGGGGPPMCKYDQLGCCTKGARCTFQHRKHQPPQHQQHYQQPQYTPSMNGLSV